MVAWIRSEQALNHFAYIVHFRTLSSAYGQIHHAVEPSEVMSLHAFASLAPEILQS